GLNGADAALLAGLPSLHGLVTLDLSENPLGPDGAAALAAAPWQRLRRLELRQCRIDAAGAAALAESPALAGLTALHLSYNAIGPEGLAALKRRLGRKGWRGESFTRPG
ncbi:MAG: hypothetical protein ACRC33_18205, partial [Gemmataceae bacterium]